MTLTPSKMGRLSWEARVKKYGKRNATKKLKEAAKLGAAKTNAIKAAKKAALDKAA